MTPTKTFAVTPPFLSTQTLELGEYGDSLPGVRGLVLDADGHPVAGASVLFDGEVGGGGKFRSAQVVTDADGGFAVDLLANTDQGAYAVTVVPPAGSAAGVLRAARRTVVVPGQPAVLIEPSTGRAAPMVCPRRVSVTGTLYLPSGAPAVAVPYWATAVRPSDGQPTLEQSPTGGTTDAAGRYQLNLDPGQYEFVFMPSGLPRRTRPVPVVLTPTVDAGSGQPTMALTDFYLSNGRTLTGSVTVTSRAGGADSTSAAPYATLRFFRVAPVAGKASALLVGEAVADERGRYSLVLPAR